MEPRTAFQSVTITEEPHEAAEKALSFEKGCLDGHLDNHLEVT
jgi:hypothetical protein